MQDYKDINQSSIFKNFFKKIGAFFVDHFHLLFKSGSENYLRIQQMRKNQVKPLIGGLSSQIGTNAGYVKNEDGTYQYSIKFESFISLKKYQKKLRRLTVSLSTAVAMVIVAFLVAPYVMNPNKSSASTFLFTQEKWSTENTLAVANYPGDNAGFESYKSKNNITVSGDGETATITTPTISSVTDANYAIAGAGNGATAGTYDSTNMYKAANILKLKKPVGAGCGTEGMDVECASDYCAGGICIDPPPCDATAVNGTKCIFGGLIYKIVLGAGGKLWMDRNLGAKKVASSYNDQDAFGWLFQWGRRADGHQYTDWGGGQPSPVLSTDVEFVSSTSIVAAPFTANFLTNNINFRDWLNPQNSTLWTGVDAPNNPCPPGFRLPSGGTGGDWDTFATAAGIKTCNTDCLNKTFNTSLKLTAAGNRSYTTGNPGSPNTGYYWTSTINGNSAYEFMFSASSVYIVNSYMRAAGFSVRCVKD